MAGPSMTDTIERTRTVIRLRAACIDPSCATFAHARYKQLNVPNYSNGVSLLPIPDTLEDWRTEHRTARKRSNRAAGLGYVFSEVDMSQYNDDRHEINTSKQERQGRPMSAGYLERHEHGPLPDYPCDQHRIHTYGVLQNDVLRAYLTLYRVGDLAMISMILGHGDHLRNDIMFLLFSGVVREHAGTGGVFFYNRHDSGQEGGLIYYKERTGFQAGDVQWVLQ